MSNYFDASYIGKKTDPTGIRIWEQNYETGNVETKDYPIEDYLYFYIDLFKKDQVLDGITSQRGTQVQRVQADSFKELRNGDAVKFFHNLNLNTYESDIEPLHKVMLDHYGKENQTAPDWNLALYDIETDVRTEDSFMSMRDKADREINAISVWYSKPNKFFNFTVVPPTLQPYWDFDTETRGNFEVRYFDNESDMLEAFFEVTKKYETIALGAWNGDFFDTKYIFDRCKRLWKEKGTAQRMGRFDKVTKTKIMLGDKEEVLIRPIGMLWFDCLETYKKNGPELESFALSAVAEEELGASKIDFEGNFETLYHGTRQDRARFRRLTPTEPYVKSKALMETSNEVGNTVIEDLGIRTEAEEKINADDSILAQEKETRIEMLITEKLGEIFEQDELKEALGDLYEDFERFIVYKRMTDTYRLFIDYSNQDSQLLYDLEQKLKKFSTVMMLAQYNVSCFYDVFSTLKQAEQGITNFAHQHMKKVVIDRDYDKSKQSYNEFVDPDLLDIRMNNDYRVTPTDSPKIKRMKTLTNQSTIPGAVVLLPNIGLITYDEKETPKLVDEYNTLKKQLEEIDEQLNNMVE